MTLPPTPPRPIAELVTVFCPKCGKQIAHQKTTVGKTIGAGAGAATGALLGAQMGIVAGPLGAIAGTIPGAILGALFGRSGGRRLDRVACKACGTAFDLP